MSDNTLNPMESKTEIIGARIVFRNDIVQHATEDTPSFLLAKKYEKGNVIRKSKWKDNEYLVSPDGHNPFYALIDEFEIL